MKKRLILLSFAFVFLGISCGKGSDGGIFRSSDGGLNWEQKVFIEKIKRRVYSIAGMSTEILIQDKEQPGLFYSGTRENGIFFTVDGGETWQRTSLQSGNISSIVLDPIDRTKLYASLGENIFKTLDGGYTWEIVYTHTNLAQIIKVVADSSTTGRVFAAATDGTVLVSDDYGNDWRIIFHNTIPMKDLLIHPFSASTLYALDVRGNVFVTYDSGVSWNNIILDGFHLQWQVAPGAIILDPTSFSTMYAVTPLRILKSTDSGNQWEILKTVIADESNVYASVKNFVVDPHNGCVLYFTVGRVIHKSVDCGANWTTTETFPSTQNISSLLVDALNPQMVYAGVNVQKKKRGFLRIER